MPQFRKDPLSDRWVIFAEDRTQRPNEYERVGRRRRDSRCPFCAGHELDTPEPIITYMSKGEWVVRVVPNKYPALMAHGQASLCRQGLYQGSDAVGAHEVIVESPRHVASFSQLTPLESSLLMRAYRDRLRGLSANAGIKYALIFKNVGPEAGASLEHTHSQIAATPLVPPQVQRELIAAKQLHEQHQACFFCRVIADELNHGQRLVATTERFVALCPYASLWPFELWVLPRDHTSHFETMETAALDELAGFLRSNLKKLESQHRHLAYNYFVHTGPFDTPALPHYHWHLEILPRLTMTAGLEWGAGYFINPLPPERAAAILRS